MGFEPMTLSYTNSYERGKCYLGQSSLARLNSTSVKLFIGLLLILWFIKGLVG